MEGAGGNLIRGYVRGLSVIFQEAAGRDFFPLVLALPRLLLARSYNGCPMMVPSASSASIP